jgi:hypothetical protein
LVFGVGGGASLLSPTFLFLNLGVGMKIISILAGLLAGGSAFAAPASDFSLGFGTFESAFVNGAPHRPSGGDFTAVTQKLGDLHVSLGEVEAESPVKPWSSWWYPLFEDYLFQARDGQPSTLERYDEVVLKASGSNPQSATYEREHIYQARSVAWAGRCDAWALASISEAEPKVPAVIRGIPFRVSDLKALLLKNYEAVQDLEHFGQRFDGKWDSLYEDVYPEQFHRFLQHYLYEKKQPFVMDRDAGIEVWNIPVWKAQSRIKADPTRADRLQVQTWLWTASPFVKDYEFVGTEEVIRDYTYDLYGRTLPDGRFEVDYGLWTGRSRWDHPDYLIPKPEQLVKRSLNTKIDPGLVDQIVQYARKERR